VVATVTATAPALTDDGRPGVAISATIAGRPDGDVWLLSRQYFSLLLA
jgi:hypothetical protein